MSSIESFDGTKIWYTYENKSDLCLVFLHGWGCDWTNWEKEMNFFKEKGYSILALDLRGHGQSDKPEEKEKYNLSCFAKDVKSVLDHEGITNFLLIGHSMGGMISLVFEKLHPQLSKGFVLCSTTATNIAHYRKERFLVPFAKHITDFILNHTNIRQEHFKNLPDIDINKFYDDPDVEIFLKGLYNTPIKSILACFEAMLEYSAEDVLKSITVPTLIIEGEQDKLLPSVHSVELFEEIPNAEIDFVPKGRHFVTLERPDLVSKYIFSFLQKHNLNS